MIIRKPWTEQELEILTLTWPSKSKNIVLEQLTGRTWFSILARARLLGLKRRFYLDPILRFVQRINKNSGIYGKSGRIQATQCWLWSGKLDKDGYGVFGVKYKTYRAHRFSYMTYVGEVPDDMTINHKCYIENCVNPEHLEILSSGDNTLDGDGPAGINSRKTQCIRGHLLEGDNLGIKNKTSRYCKICDKNKPYRIKQRFTNFRNGTKKERWSLEEIEILKNLYNNVSDDELLSLLPRRSLSSMRVKIKRLFNANLN